MRTTFPYSTCFTLSVYALDTKVDLNMGCKALSEIVDYAERIFNDDTMFHGDAIEQIIAIDSETGEVIAEFANDKDNSFDDYDWNYNEDMGFDPYEGGYTYDC